MTTERLFRHWFARPDYDDFIMSLDLKADGTGTVESHGGQALCLIADFAWTRLEGDRLRLDFQDTNRDGRRWYTRVSGLECHEIAYSLREGRFPFHVPLAMGTVDYRLRLDLSDSPLPLDAAKYHEGNLFFTVVNHIDPRSFKTYYSDMVR